MRTRDTEVAPHQAVEEHLTSDLSSSLQVYTNRLGLSGLGATLMLVMKHKDWLCAEYGMLVLLCCKIYKKERGILLCFLADLDVTPIAMCILLDPAVHEPEVQSLVFE